MKRPDPALIGALACLVGALAGCKGTAPPLVAFSPKCPEHLQAWQAADSAHGEVVVQVVSAIPAAGLIASLPEVHDCQRLITSESPGRMSYGPLGVLFASDSLLSLFAGADTTGTQFPRRAAATINSWPAGYGELHLPAGWSCLYIVRRPRMAAVHQDLSRVRTDSGAVSEIIRAALRTTARTFVDSALVGADLRKAILATPEALGAGAQQYTYLAYIVEVDDPGRCDNPASASLLADAPSLGVAATPVTQLLGAQQLLYGRDFSAARWDADFGNGGHSQHISIRCGDAWCDVMPLDATGPVPELIPDGLPANALTQLKGFYDQQYLAVSDPANPGPLVPGPTLATYAPVAGIAGFTPSNFENWTAVGYIILSGPSAQYKEKLNLSEGLNTVSMRRGRLRPDETPFNRCRGVEKESEDANKHEADPWWVRIETAEGVKSYFCSYQHVHDSSGTPLPGFVRWRWMEDDETTWQRCSTGCCPIS